MRLCFGGNVFYEMGQPPGPDGRHCLCGHGRYAADYLPHAGNYWSWRSRHRGWSHWPLLYLGLIFFLSRLEEGQLTALPTADLTTIGIYICIGALLHIAEDAVCGKVPLLTPYQKVGVRLFKVGSVPEYLFTIAAVLLCYGLRTHFSFLS